MQIQNGIFQTLSNHHGLLSLAEIRPKQAKHGQTSSDTFWDKLWPQPADLDLLNKRMSGDMWC